MRLKILYTSKEVKNEIANLFSNKNARRVAVTAFVGNGADAFLRYHNGIEIYCWPLAGATNSDALEVLQKKGVTIFFSNNSHIKLYWADGAGAIITSANLSENALGASIQKEIGILIDDSLIDINKVLKYINFYKPKKSDFDKLRRKNNEIISSKLFANKKGSQKTFPDWYKAPDAKQRWKLAHFEPDANYGICADAKEIALEKYGCHPYTCLGCEENYYKQGEWVLCFQSKNKKHFSNFSWMYLDYISKISEEEKGKYGENIYQAIQVRQRKNEFPPFKIVPTFKVAFKEVFRKTTDAFYDAALEKTKLSQKILDAIFNFYKTVS